MRRNPYLDSTEIKETQTRPGRSGWLRYRSEQDQRPGQFEQDQAQQPGKGVLKNQNHRNNDGFFDNGSSRNNDWMTRNVETQKRVDQKRLRSFRNQSTDLEIFPLFFSYPSTRTDGTVRAEFKKEKRKLKVMSIYLFTAVDQPTTVHNSAKKLAKNRQFVI
uniref:Uncharacterized protein n=1 Tax=Caenorhabditis tropicalis TaxID=1561998 RepID=A0A1I7V1T1_9PELO